MERGMRRLGSRAVRRTLAAALVLAAAASPGAAAPAPQPGPAQGIARFESRVRPLLVKHCSGCHGGSAAKGGLRLDSVEGIRKGGAGGPAVATGDPTGSRLLAAVRHSAGVPAMPPGTKLSDADLRLLEEWIQAGAAMPAPGAGPDPGPKAPVDLWSLKPLRRVPPGPVRLKAWPRRRIDHYLLARAEREGLASAPPASRRTLLRRLSFDLTGLPPTPAELHEFETDARPEALERQVDRLLASPHYGERWGRHWLDLVRYCDVPEQWAQAEAQPWLYRDWVIRALNRDMPYDRFVRLQLAADREPGTGPEDLAALGFLGLSPTYWKELKLAPGVIKTVVAEEWEERITALSGALLGLTIGCARCHDHKSDPVTLRDYYALAGIFASTRQTVRPLLPASQAAAVLAARKEVARLEAEGKRLAEQAQKNPAADLRSRSEAALAEARRLRGETPGFDAPTAYVVDDAGLHVLPDGPDRTRLEYREAAPFDVAVQLRGNPEVPGPVVPRGYPALLSNGVGLAFTEGSGRYELGKAIFERSSPLAARVIVNRVWRHHFGRGLVETPSNFGVTGDRPSHPELLDDLAARFVEAGWSLKWLHREIVLSAAYGQSSAGSAEGVARDPENRFLARMTPRRLEVEAWRDAILAASGSLDRTLGGEPRELQNGDNRRRTVYGIIRRRDLDELLRLYDFPDPTWHSPARFHTTTPIQQLYVLNSGFISRMAAALVERLQREAAGGHEARVRLAWELLYGRTPGGAETAAALRFLENEPGGAGDPWLRLAEVLLSRNELMFVD